MKLVIEMNLDNAAFHDDDGDLDMSAVAGHLDRVADKIRSGNTSNAIMDMNGNKCGTYEICGENEEED